MCYDHIYTMPTIFLTILPKIRGLTKVKGTTIGLNFPWLRRSSREDMFFQKYKRESEKQCIKLAFKDFFSTVTEP